MKSYDLGMEKPYPQDLQPGHHNQMWGIMSDGTGSFGSSPSGQQILYNVQESNNSYKRQLIHVLIFTALAVKTILFVENDGPNRQLSGSSSSGGFMADIPNWKSQ